MPVPSAIVGSTTEPVTHTVDNRWIMAYAASLRDHAPVYLDTTRAYGLIAHPLFPVCLEWPVVLLSRRVPGLVDTLTHDEARRGIHATHDLTIERMIQADQTLTTVGEVIGVERRSPGAFMTLEMRTTDASGALVCRTVQGSLFLGVDVEGEDRPAPVEGPELPDHDDRLEAELDIEIGPGDAHTYTECARIWNPIHTDLAVAHDAGLPGLILHGTATLAHAVSVAVHAVGRGDPRSIRRVRGRFGAWVPMPSVLTVRLYRNDRFEVVGPDGTPAIRDGHLTFA
ncbi:MAG: hypothetical protein FJW83_09965 [Actinobacteria bacterium]|nr:hypothetical protein [Actinomycetota bacterium]